MQKEDIDIILGESDDEDLKEYTDPIKDIIKMSKKEMIQNYIDLENEEDNESIVVPSVDSEYVRERKRKADAYTEGLLELAESEQPQKRLKIEPEFIQELEDVSSIISVTGTDETIKINFKKTVNKTVNNLKDFDNDEYKQLKELVLGSDDLNNKQKYKTLYKWLCENISVTDMYYVSRK